MKVLVDATSNQIHGVYEEPLNFDTSGHYTIDISTFIASVVPGSDPSVPDLITAKNAAWLAFINAPGVSPLLTPVLVFDELLNTNVPLPQPYVDLTTGTIVAMTAATIKAGAEATLPASSSSPPTKRVLVRPGGTVLTNPISAIPGSYRSFFHYSGFSLYRAAVDPTNPTNPTSGPSKMLYNYNPTLAGFNSFQNSNFTITLCAAAGPFTDFATLKPDFLFTPSAPFPASFRLKFKNTSTGSATLPYYLSDWILIYGG